MNPFLLIKIQEAYDAAVVAREELKKVLDTINLEGVESEEYHQNMQHAEGSVSYSIQIGLIPMDLVTLLQQDVIPVQIKNHMFHIARIMNEMKEYVEDAMDTQDTEEINESLTSALDTAQEIENRWELICQIAGIQIAEGQPVNLSSNVSNNEYNNESNNEFSGGYKKRTGKQRKHKKRTGKRTEKRKHKKRTERRREKRRGKRTLRVRARK